MDLSLIIPAYNEEKTIEKVVMNYYKLFKKKKLDFEIILSVDGCKDRTPQIAKKLAKKHKQIKTNFSKEKRGKGGGVFSAFPKAKGKFIGITDSDESVSPEQFYEMFSQKQNADVVIGSRWLPQSKNIGSSLFRKFLGRGFNYYIRLLFFLPYRDTQCGSKIIKRKLIKPIQNQLRITDWAWDINLLYLLKKQEAKVMEYPITWINSDRKSKFNYKKAVLQMALSTLRLRLIYSPISRLRIPGLRKVKGKIYCLLEN